MANTFSINLNSFYFSIDKEKLPSQYTGTVLTLPLYFEDTSITLEQFNKNMNKSLHLITIVHFPGEVDSVVSRLIRKKIYNFFPVLSSNNNSIVYLPQVISKKYYRIYSSRYSKYSITNKLEDFSIDMEFQQFLGNQLCTGADLASFEYTRRPVYYNLPEVENTTLKNHMQTQIHTRYFKPRELIVRYENNPGVIDSFLPFFSIGTYCPVSRGNHASDGWSGNARAISPLTADLVQCKQIPLAEIVELLGYSLEAIKSKLLVVKAKKYTINFAGVGGTGINTIVWLSELCKLTNVKNLFNIIHIFEKDNIDFSNIFRFPIPLSRYTCKTASKLSKIELIEPYTDTLSSIVYTHDTFLETITDIPLYQLDNDKLKHNVVTYGAPSIANRNFLSSVGNFISATHANNTASLWINPIADDNLQIETYGLIQLNSFFVNQIHMAITLLDILSSPDNLSLQDTLWSDMTFTGTSSKKYNFAIATELTATPIGED